MSSHASNGAAEATWLWRDVDAESCWQRFRRGDVSRDVMSLLSHVGDHAAEVTEPQCDAGADDHGNVTTSLICI
jgi:hypothetical protein